MSRILGNGSVAPAGAQAIYRAGSDGPSEDTHKSHPWRAVMIQTEFTRQSPIKRSLY